MLNSNDLEFLFDLGDSQLLFPPEIAVTTQRPDIVIFSRSKKAVLFVELMVPLEDHVATGHTQKEKRYAGLVQQCTENGRFAHCFAVEVGCLGFLLKKPNWRNVEKKESTDDLAMFHHPCFTALNPFGYQALLPANFEMNIVVSLTDVVTPSSSEETVWSGLPGPWVEFSTFLKLALALLSVLIWQLASSLYVFPLSQSCSPMPNAATMLALCAYLFTLSGLPARPPHDDHSLVSISIRLRSYGIFSQCTWVFHRRMDVACVHSHM